MKERFSGCIAITIVLVFFESAAVSQGELKYEELPNFHQVNEHLYRGGQPKRGGIQRLGQLGVKSIINLRGNDERSLAEEQEARAAGLKYFSVPLQRLGRPTEEQIERVLLLISATANHPVFVHCHRGADRTGTVIAIYRIGHDGWSGKRAKAEAGRYGLKPWQLGMKDFVGDYYRRRLTHTATSSVSAAAH